MSGGIDERYGEVIIEFRLRPDAKSTFVSFRVHELLMREALAPVDHYRSPGDPRGLGDMLVEHCFCTPPEKIRERLHQREVIKDLVSARIASVISEQLGSADTIMGYRK